MKYIIIGIMLLFFLITACIVFTVLQMEEDITHKDIHKKYKKRGELMVKAIICGSRNFCNYTFLDEKCREVFGSISNTVMFGDYEKDITIIEIISGGAKGADELGERFAFNNSIEIKKFPAQWDRYGKQAGMLRNTEMINYAARKEHEDDYGMLIAFWDGESKGTKQAIDYAKRMKLDVKVFIYKGRKTNESNN